MDNYIVVKHKKTALSPSWDPKPCKVRNVQGTELTLKRQRKVKVISMEMCKPVTIPKSKETRKKVMSLHTAL